MPTENPDLTREFLFRFNPNITLNETNPVKAEYDEVVGSDIGDMPSSYNKILKPEEIQKPSQIDPLFVVHKVTEPPTNPISNSNLKLTSPSKFSGKGSYPI